MTPTPFAWAARVRAALLSLAVVASGLAMTAAPAHAAQTVVYASFDCAAPTMPALPDPLYLAGGDTLELMIQGANKCDYIQEAGSAGAGGAGLFGSGAYAAVVSGTPGAGQAISSGTTTISLTALADPSGQVVLELSKGSAAFQFTIAAGGTANTVLVSGDMTPSATIRWTGRAVEVWLCRSAIQYSSCANETSSLVFSVTPSQTSLLISPSTSASQRDGTTVTIGSTQTWTVIVNNGTSAADSAPFPTVRVMSSGGGTSPNGTAANLAVSGDGTNSLTFSWTGDARLPLVFCPPNVTYSTCLPMNMGSTPQILFYYWPLQGFNTTLSSPVTLSVGDSVRCVGGPNCTTTITAGQYSVFIDNGASGSNVLQVSFGPGGASQAPVIDLTPVPPSISPLAAATFDTTATAGSSVACVSPGWDKTPTSVTISAAIDGALLGSTQLTAAPFRAQFAVPATAAGKALVCEIRAAFGSGTHTISVQSVIAGTGGTTGGGSSSTGGGTTTPTTPTPPTTPACTLSSTVLGFANASTSLSSATRRAAAAIKNCTGTIVVTGYALPGSARATALSRARAEAAAEVIRSRNPEATVQIVAAGGKRNAACSATSNRCVVVSRG